MSQHRQIIFVLALLVAVPAVAEPGNCFSGYNDCLQAAQFGQADVRDCFLFRDSCVANLQSPAEQTQAVDWYPDVFDPNSASLTGTPDTTPIAVTTDTPTATAIDTTPPVAPTVVTQPGPTPAQSPVEAQKTAAEAFKAAKKEFKAETKENISAARAELKEARKEVREAKANLTEARHNRATNPEAVKEARQELKTARAERKEARLDLLKLTKGFR